MFQNLNLMETGVIYGESLLKSVIEFDLKKNLISKAQKKLHYQNCNQCQQHSKTIK